VHLREAPRLGRADQQVACQIDNVTHEIISYSGVPPYPTVAILENLSDRGGLLETEGNSQSEREDDCSR
jgi:hypothetical protein